ncbi:MAG: hypothetical protein ACI93T_001512 [Porticoccaceae bacterium]|jgi:hypothetical protein
MDTKKHECFLDISNLFVLIRVHSWFERLGTKLRQAKPDLQAFLQKVSQLRRLHLSELVEA